MLFNFHSEMKKKLEQLTEQSKQDKQVKPTNSKPVNNKPVNSKPGILQGKLNRYHDEHDQEVVHMVEIISALCVGRVAIGTTVSAPKMPLIVPGNTLVQRRLSTTACAGQIIGNPNMSKGIKTTSMPA